MLGPGVDVKEPTAGDETVDMRKNIPEAVWNLPPAQATRGSCKIDEKGRLSEITANGRTFPTSKEFPSVKVLVMKDGKPAELKNLPPEDELWEMTYDDGSVLKLDVRANVWAYTKDGITYDGYSPPNPPNGAIKPKPPFTWGMRWGNYGERFAEGSFGVWRNGTFTIKVPGVRAVKPPRVVGASDKDQAPPAYQANYDGRVLTITIKDKDPIDHPMLVFEPAGELKE